MPPSDDAAPPSRYQRFRRRFAPVALVLALGLVGYHEWSRRADQPDTIELRFGGHVREIRHVRADVLIDGAPRGDHFERDLASGYDAPVRFPAVLDGDHASVLVEVATATGLRRIERPIAPGSHGTIVVDLAPALDAPPR